MVVKPGYKQSEVGVIPEDWMACAITQLLENDTRITYGVVQPGTNDANGVLFIRGGDILGGRIQTSKLRRIPVSVANHYTRTRLQGGEIVISLVGYPGETAVVPHWLAGANIARQVALVRVSGNSPIGRDYLATFLQAPPGQRALLREAIGSAQQVINLREINRVTVSAPPTRAEQEAIAGALSDVDALIESLEQLVAKKRQIKHGAMQQLLTSQKRLPGFTGKWKTGRLGHLGATYGGLTGKAKADFGNGAARYITFMNIMTNVVIDCTAFELVDVSPIESQNRARKGDLFFNGSSETPEEVAMCAVLTEDTDDLYLNSFCFGFRFHGGIETNGLFLAYYIRSKVGRRLMKSLAQGSTRYNLSKVALLNSSLELPTLQEQNAIAAVLSDMDAEIAALEAKLAKARQVKQGMMQELLTGRIRLIVQQATADHDRPR
jgi:type I restriction enzyme, S subunit